MRALRPDVIVNAAAHTAVDKAESEPEFAATLNAEAPRVLAEQAKALGAWLVHYSTDYVFDGSGSSARSEDAPTGPLSIYGRTKLDGENHIRASGCTHLIFRTSWVYAARGGNFARTMLKLAGERDALSVIDDQIRRADRRRAAGRRDRACDARLPHEPGIRRHLPCRGRRRDQLVRLRALRHRLGARQWPADQGGCRCHHAGADQRLPHAGQAPAQFTAGYAQAARQRSTSRCPTGRSA